MSKKKYILVNGVRSLLIEGEVVEIKKPTKEELEESIKAQAAELGKKPEEKGSDPVKPVGRNRKKATKKSKEEIL